MSKDLKTVCSWHRVDVVWVRQFLPAALGAGAALLLGSSGFALGCLYAGWLAPATAAAAPATAPPAASLVLAPAEAVGGPEEPAPGAQSPEPPVAVAADPGSRPALSRPVTGGWVSSSFGRRQDPFTGQPAVHRGLDFAGLDNSAILSVAPGVVTWSGRRSGYGNLIEIDHGRGWVTRYGHNAINLVAPGDYVKPGQTIALMGATGRATGTHLHFEVLYRGRHQDPARFVPRAT